MTGQSSGLEGKCGYHAVTHDDAEKMLFDKLTEVGLSFDAADSQADRCRLARQERVLGESPANSCPCTTPS